MIRWKVPKIIDEKYKELQIPLDVLKAKRDLRNFERYAHHLFDNEEPYLWQPSRKLKAYFKLKPTEDLEKEIVSALSKEIAKEIDNDILEKLNGQVENQ